MRLKWPHITKSFDGEYILEWWHKERKLTFYILFKKLKFEYIKVWGPDIVTDMEDGKISFVKLFQLWKWLYK